MTPQANEMLAALLDRLKRSPAAPINRELAADRAGFGEGELF
jgi:hypothetical protein